jgi:hypothetical protein
MRKHLAAISLVLVLVGLLTTSGVIQAEQKTTHVIYGWDIGSGKFENGNISTTWGAYWTSFLHQIDFDAKPYTVPCGTTRWAGQMEFALYHTDNAPAGAPGFQQSRNWSLVKCDRDGDGDFDGTDRAPAAGAAYLDPSLVLETCTGTSAYCRLVSSDIVSGANCGGNCTDEIITTFAMDLDTDCNGTIDNPDIDAAFNGGGLCFYAEGLTPFPPWGPLWGGNVQGRITAGGGDKTVNFNPIPNAVELASFRATPQAWTRTILLEWETVSEVDNVGFNLYRAESPTGRQIRLNASLIPSQGPGSPIGFKYSFADRTALTGRTYYYWLEAVDVYGMTASYGPVSAAIPPQIGVPKPSKP